MKYSIIVFALLTCSIVSFTFKDSQNHGVLDVKKEVPGKVVSLSTEGTLDWVHWGFVNGTSIENRKTNPVIKISNLSKIGDSEIHTYANNATQYTWTNGMLEGKTNSGIFLGGNSHGFQFTIPADEKMRIFKVYVGVWNSKAKFEATLSDGTAPAYVNTELISTGQTEVDIINAVYVIRYKASSAGKNLMVKFTQVEPRGNIELQATTLAEAL